MTFVNPLKPAVPFQVSLPVQDEPLTLGRLPNFSASKDIFFSANAPVARKKASRLTSYVAAGLFALLGGCATSNTLYAAKADAAESPPAVTQVDNREQTAAKTSPRTVPVPDPLKTTTQEQRNDCGCDDDGARPKLTALDQSQLAKYLEERTVKVTIEGGTHIDITQPPKAEPYNESIFGDSFGSGFFCRKNGGIITNVHVVDEAIRHGYKIKVTLATGEEFEAEVKAYDVRSDVALIQLKNVGDRQFPTIRLIKNSNNVSKGEFLAAMGNPRGRTFTYSHGLASGTRRPGPGTNQGGTGKLADIADDQGQMTTSIAPGSSGGPVVNKDGAAVGITQSYINDAGDLYFYAEANSIGDLLKVYDEKLPTDGMLIGVQASTTSFSEYPHTILRAQQKLHAAKGALLLAEDKLKKFNEGPLAHTDPEMKGDIQPAGKKYQDEVDAARKRVEEFTRNAERLQGEYGKAVQNVTVPIQGGVIILEVSAGGFANAAGLQSNDVVTHVEGKPVNAQNFTNTIKGHYKFQTLTITYHRGGKVHQAVINPDGPRKAVEEPPAGNGAAGG